MIGFVKIGNTFYNLDRVEKMVWNPDKMTMEMYYFGDGHEPGSIVIGIPATALLKYMVRKGYTISDGEDYVRAD